MPNWRHNVLYTLNSSAKKDNEIMSFLKSENSVFDFNNIIPTPQELKVPFSNKGKIGIELINGTYCGIELSSEMKKECIELGKKYLSNTQKYGYPTWFEWRKEYWGTKWNARNVNIREDSGKQFIEFDTAWTLPLDIFFKLSSHFPGITFVVLSVHEFPEEKDYYFQFLNGKCIYNSLVEMRRNRPILTHEGTAIQYSRTEQEWYYNDYCPMTMKSLSTYFELIESPKMDCSCTFFLDEEGLNF